MNKIITPTANNNIILWLLSYLCLPFSNLFNYLKITPNILTFFSFIFLVFGCRELLNENLSNFCLFFLISIILDICDGQVARISKNINKSKLNIDHLTDILKISIIFLSFGILFNDKNSWIIIFITNFFYLFFCILHAEVGSYKKLSFKKKNRFRKPIFFHYFSINLIWMFYKILLPMITTFNVHSLLLILLILIDLKFFNFILIYFTSVFIYRIFKNLYFLSKQKLQR